MYAAIRLAGGPEQTQGFFLLGFCFATHAEEYAYTCFRRVWLVGCLRCALAGFTLVMFLACGVSIRCEDTVECEDEPSVHSADSCAVRAVRITPLNLLYKLNMFAAIRLAGRLARAHGRFSRAFWLTTHRSELKHTCSRRVWLAWSLS